MKFQIEGNQIDVKFKILSNIILNWILNLNIINELGPRSREKNCQEYYWGSNLSTDGGLGDNMDLG